jgi:hypothetical protein
VGNPDVVKNVVNERNWSAVTLRGYSPPRSVCLGTAQRQRNQKLSEGREQRQKILKTSR